MNSPSKESVAVLETGLFDDAATLATAIERSVEPSSFSQIRLQPENMKPQDWDDVVALVLSVSKVITV